MSCTALRETNTYVSNLVLLLKAQHIDRTLSTSTMVQTSTCSHWWDSRYQIWPSKEEVPSCPCGYPLRKPSSNVCYLWFPFVLVCIGKELFRFWGNVLGFKGEGFCINGNSGWGKGSNGKKGKGGRGASGFCGRLGCWLLILWCLRLGWGIMIMKESLSIGIMFSRN